MADRPSISGGLGRTGGAEAFINSAVVGARRSGYDVPGLNHWLLAVCARQFIARAIIRDFSVSDVRSRAQAEIDAGNPGTPVDPMEIMAIAAELASEAGDASVHEWHLVMAVASRAGLHARSANHELGDTPPEPSSGPVDTAHSTANAPSPREAEKPAKAPHRPRLPVFASLAAKKSSRHASTPMLDECTVDLTAMAAAGMLGPVVGRERELSQIIETLCRPSKANPMLIGEPGVGKSALVEGLAARIAAGEVPALLWGRRLVALNMGSLLKESRYYGVLEQRLGAVVEEARSARAILFVDESHAIVSAGGREGSGDVATLLKPALARGDLSVIGATTDDEYRRIVAADAALERRFVPIRVQEPGREAVQAILRATREALYRTNGVRVDDEALEHVQAIAATRMPHRKEPDRTKDLLEQAVAGAMASGESKVDRAAVEAAADRLSGVPAFDAARISSMAQDLETQGLLSRSDAAAIATRLEVTLGGFELHPERPRLVVLVTVADTSDAPQQIAAIAAEAAFGTADRVIEIDVAAITEQNQISSLVGTSQGFVGYGAGLPIYEVAQKPFSVVLLSGLSTCHSVVRAVLAKALQTGYLVDGSGRRVYLSSAIVVAECRAPSRQGAVFGFGARPRGDEPVASIGPDALASLVGEELAGEVDLCVSAPNGPVAGNTPMVRRLLDDLAARYQVSAIDLSWTPEVERSLADQVASLANARQREQYVEEQMAACVRPHLDQSRRPIRLRVLAGPSGFQAEVA